MPAERGTAYPGFMGTGRDRCSSGTVSARSGSAGRSVRNGRKPRISPNGSNGRSVTRIERDRLMLAEMKTALEGRSPRAVLARGYCVAEKDGIVVKSVDAMRENDRLNLRFYDGRSRVVVERVDHDGNL